MFTSIVPRNVRKMQAFAGNTKLEKQLCFLHCPVLEKGTQDNPRSWHTLHDVLITTSK
jgi:hypothetical protein